jgi:hypothetical protein
MADPVFVFQLPEIDLRLGMQDKTHDKFSSLVLDVKLSLTEDKVHYI